MESVADIPVISPASDMRLLLCIANANPARLPDISTSASFSPKTMEPTYCRRSSSSMAMSCSSCRASSSYMPCASGISRIISS